MLAVAAGLSDTPALAQSSAVTVDRSVLDALGPVDSTANQSNRIRLHRPVEPAQQRPNRPAGGKPPPMQASNSPTAAGAPAPAPAPQAALAPSTAPPSPPTLAPAPAVASTPPAASPSPPIAAERILFHPEDANLADDAKQELDRLAVRLGADARLYVQLVAYASAGGGDASQARRLSLTRALAARGYLVDHGVDIKQIDVRPLGAKSEPGTVPDRIDLMVTQR